MPFLRREPPASAKEEPAAAGGDQIDARRVLQELWKRWRDAPTLEYRSEARISHRGEFALTVKTHAALRRPNLARIVFSSNEWAEASRVRVSNGRTLYDRQTGKSLARPRTLRMGFRGRVTADIPHPLDEAGYSVDQFFSPTPFLPRGPWGTGQDDPEVSGTLVAAPAPFKGKAYRVVIEKGVARDVLHLDALTYAPLLLTRRGDHAGMVQDLLRETFHEFGLGTLSVTPTLFAWTADDERGVVRDR